MRFARPVPFAATAAVAICAAGAVAALPAGAADAPAAPAVRLASCDVRARVAAFQADMAAVPGASRLQMRFSVARRDGRRWRRVRGPRLDRWVSSQPGSPRYVYDKRVANLPRGGDYRVHVRFRWLADDGTVMRTERRRSRTCRIPDLRANLVPVRVEVLPSDLPGMRVYVVTVVNRGRSAAPASSVALTAGDTGPAAAAIPPVRPGGRERVAIDAPDCAAPGAIVAVADADGAVDESDEADNALAVACPQG
jgi:hypothetical protein